MTELEKPFPSLSPFNCGRLRVSELHEIYFEEYGNPKGKPAVYLHGGPGGGSDSSQAEFFHPQKYRAILFDQRGCGKSTPYAELRDNTTWDLVADMEQLRAHLGIDKWQICGGSWGSSLALAYAQTHPDRVSEIILRGIFTLRRAELKWFYQEGASWIYPDVWERFIAPIPPPERDDLIRAYHRRLTGDDKEEQLKCAQTWSSWEGATLSLMQDDKREGDFARPEFALPFARIECHYFINGGFFSPEDQLIRSAEKIRHIPAVIVQGRYDVVTPMQTAWELHRAWPEAEFKIVQNAGHVVSEPGIAAEIIKATNRFAGD